MIGFYDYTVILTFISVGSSVVGMCFASQQEYLGAIVCLLISGLLDMFDGMVARTKKNRTEAEKKNGIQLDSLADVICFGAFPAVMGYTLAADCKYCWLVAGIVGVIYVLAAVIRLAYFNVTEEIRQQQTSEKRKSYEGLPVTSVALIIPALFCFKGYIGVAFPFCYSICLFLIAMFFVLKIKVTKLGKTGNTIMIIAGIILFALLVALQVNGLN